jgi:hypothetical protein
MFSRAIVSIPMVLLLMTPAAAFGNRNSMRLIVAQGSASGQELFDLPMTDTMWNLVSVTNGVVDVFLIDTSIEMPEYTTSPLSDWALRHGRWMLSEGLIQSVFDLPENFEIPGETMLVSTTGTQAAWGLWDPSPEWPISGDERLLVAEISGLGAGEVEIQWLDVILFPTTIAEAIEEVAFLTDFTETPNPPGEDQRPCRGASGLFIGGVFVGAIDPCIPAEGGNVQPAVEGDVAQSSGDPGGCYATYDSCMDSAGYLYKSESANCKEDFIFNSGGGMLVCAAIPGPGGLACAAAVLIGTVGSRHNCIEAARASRRAAEALCQGVFLTCCGANGNCPLAAIAGTNP